MKNRCFRFDEVEIDVQNLRVTVGSEIRPPEPKSFRLLLLLAENPGRVLPKEEIMRVVWPDAFETVPSVGYRFVPVPTVEQSGDVVTPPANSKPPLTSAPWLVTASLPP